MHVLCGVVRVVDGMKRNASSSFLPLLVCVCVTSRALLSLCVLWAGQEGLSPLLLVLEARMLLVLFRACVVQYTSCSFIDPVCYVHLSTDHRI
jgi:hypothetical protein